MYDGDSVDYLDISWSTACRKLLYIMKMFLKILFV